MDWDKILDDQEGEDSGYEALPADKYPVRVQTAEATTASTGAKMLKLTLEVMGGPYDKRLVWTNIVFSVDNPNAMRYTLRKLRALGVSREYIASNKPSMEQLAKMVEGATAVAEVTKRPWEGEDRNDVKSFKKVEDDLPSAPSAPHIPTPTITEDEDIVVPPPPPIVSDDEPVLGSPDHDEEPF